MASLTNKNRPKFTKMLAVNALVMYYRESPIDYRQEIDAIIQEYSCAPLVVQKLNLKLIRLQLNNIVVQCVINSLPEIKRNIMLYRFKEQKKIVAISMTLHISIQMLQRYEEQVVLEIETMMFYKIVAETISLTKIMNMINIINMQIVFLENQLLKIDIDFLKFLKHKKERYISLQRDLTEHIAMQGELKKIILCELLNNKYDKNMSELANQVNVSNGLVSQCAGELKKNVFNKYEDIIITKK